MKINITGLGFVGSAMFQCFRERCININNIIVTGYDKYKKQNDKDEGIGVITDMLDADIVFTALPTPYNANTKSYDLTPIHDVCAYLADNSYNGCVVVKSTVEPQTCDILADKYGLNIVHNPEFLSAKTAYDDFNNQSHIVLGKTVSCGDNYYNAVCELYSRLWPNAVISRCTAVESECCKLYCNSFYAVKIQYFNELYAHAQSQGADYNTVRDMMVRNGWINPMHTNVPGSDGRFSYGGMCFVKDTTALYQCMERAGTPSMVLDATITERNKMRDDHDNIITK